MGLILNEGAFTQRQNVSFQTGAVILIRFKSNVRDIVDLPRPNFRTFFGPIANYLAHIEMTGQRHLRNVR